MDVQTMEQRCAALRAIMDEGPRFFCQSRVLNDHCVVKETNSTNVECYDFLKRQLFPIRVDQDEMIDAELGEEFVAEYATGSVLRSVFGFTWRFENTDDAFHFKMRYC